MSKHYVGEVLMWCGHEVRVTDAWKEDGGDDEISFVPTGKYGFELHCPEKRFDSMNEKYEEENKDEE